MSLVVVLRPEPGASATCRRAAALGLEALAAPLFTVRPVAWELTDEAFDAVLLTSANAARYGGEALSGLTHLPVYTVGEATARAARAAGFAKLKTADGDGAAALALIDADRPGRVLHLAGREHVALESARVPIERRVVYAADAVDALPDALRDWPGGAIALLHSPRAAAVFRALLEQAGVTSGGIAIAALSPAIATAAGPGWRAAATAASRDDDALLAAAARLCETPAAA